MDVGHSRSYGAQAGCNARSTALKVQHFWSVAHDGTNYKIGFTTAHRRVFHTADLHRSDHAFESIPQFLRVRSRLRVDDDHSADAEIASDIHRYGISIRPIDQHMSVPTKGREDSRQGRACVHRLGCWTVAEHDALAREKIGRLSLSVPNAHCCRIMRQFLLLPA